MPLLADYVARALTPRQRILWARRSRRGNPRIKALPTEVLGERLAPSAELSRVFYLVRTAQSSVQCEPVTPDVLAEHATRAGLRELKTWLETLQMIAANDVIESAFPTPEQVAEELRALYGEAFASARTVLVRVPRQCPAADLLEALRRDGRL